MMETAVPLLILVMEHLLYYAEETTNAHNQLNVSQLLATAMQESALILPYQITPHAVLLLIDAL
jgi:hypothetical protein